MNTSREWEKEREGRGERNSIKFAYVPQRFHANNLEYQRLYHVSKP